MHFSFLVPTRRRGNAFLVPTRRRGNAFSLLQQSGPQARKNGMPARPESVPTPARGNQKKTGCRRVPNRFPRRRVGTRKKRDAGASRIGSHAGAWEPEKNGMPARPESVPTPARGNQKIGSQKKRDAGTSRIGSHAGAWEPESPFTTAQIQNSGSRFAHSIGELGSRCLLRGWQILGRCLTL